MSKQVKAEKKRPTIVVERVYSGTKSMKQVFQWITTEQIRRNMEQNEANMTEKSC